MERYRLREREAIIVEGKRYPIRRLNKEGSTGGLYDNRGELLCGYSVDELSGKVYIIDCNDKEWRGDSLLGLLIEVIQSVKGVKIK